MSERGKVSPAALVAFFRRERDDLEAAQRVVDQVARIRVGPTGETEITCPICDGSGRLPEGSPSSNCPYCRDGVLALNELLYARKEFNTITDRLQECVQKHGLGLGGERIDRLVCDEVDRLRASTEGSQREVTKLRNALMRCAAWFYEYANIHAAKGATEKAERNQARADYCYRTLATTPTPEPTGAEPARFVDPAGLDMRALVDLPQSHFTERDDMT